MSTTPRTASLLIELGTEDLPMQSVATLAEHARQSVEAALIDDGFKDKADEYKADGSEVDTGWFATPRRLAFRIKDLPAALPEKDVERKGPSLEAALDADGVPNAAGLGFAKSCGVAFEELEHRDGRLYFQGRVAGASLADRVEHHLQSILAKAPMSKRMRWGDEPYEFVRPLHWLLALHGEELLEMEVMGIQAGKLSYGHRAYCQAPIAIDSAEDSVYEDTLEGKGRVIVSLQERTKMIVKQFVEWGGHAGGAQGENSLWIEVANSYDSPFQETVPITSFEVNGGWHLFSEDELDRALFAFAQERAAMTECPGFIKGTISNVDGFETLRHALLVQALMKSQHLLLKADYNRKNSKEFLAVVDLDTNCSDKAAICHNLERIACARIADAVFFLNKDIETGLAPLQRNLHKVTFHRALGSLKDKSQRLILLSQLTAEMIQKKDPSDFSNFSLNKSVLQEAAKLCKLDLLSDTVREYPALQGEIGGRLILEKDTSLKGSSVADIVVQHYMPRPGSSFLPSTSESCILALVDRIDTLTGIFGSGERPTGSKDPYALRRASIAMIRLILHLAGRDYILGTIPLEEDLPSYPKIDVLALIDESSHVYQQQIAPFTDEAVQAVKDYFVERLKHYYLSGAKFGRAFLVGHVAAAIAVRPGDVIDLDTRIVAIYDFYKYRGEKMIALIDANKRIKNILRKNQASLPEQTTIREDVLDEEAERVLYERVQSCENATKDLIGRKQYETMLELMHDELVQPLDNFFNKVMVMADDPIQRQNRLLLLQQVQSLFMQVGDLSKLHLPGEDDDNS